MSNHGCLIFQVDIRLSDELLQFVLPTFCIYSIFRTRVVLKLYGLIAQLVRARA